MRDGKAVTVGRTADLGIAVTADFVDAGAVGAWAACIIAEIGGSRNTCGNQQRVMQ